MDDYGDFVEAVVRRYQGRIDHYQIWNEPNIYPEWGETRQPGGVHRAAEVGYTRAKQACPECVVISGALAQTIPLGPRDLNDFIFLQRMYDAGAGDYFDMLAMQGYGLWSGPTDRRMRPRVLNFSRPLYMREIMVENGDAHKPIWISEMNWNAPPPELPDKPFGSVTLEQQARYAVLAYQRAQHEWPWLGVVNAWFFKRASDAEQDQAMYYFRMVEPDFSPLPVYDALKDHMHSAEALVLYPGVYQEDHWALIYDGAWETQTGESAELGMVRAAIDPQSEVTFTFSGTDLWLKAGPAEGGTFPTASMGRKKKRLHSPQVSRSNWRGRYPRGSHAITIRATPGPLSLDSLTIRDRATTTPWLIAGGIVLAIGLVVGLVAALIARRRRWYQRSRAGR